MRNVHVLCAAIVVAATSVAAGAEDLTVVYRTTGPGGEGTSTQYFGSERMRIHDDEQDMIYDFSTGTIVSIDHTRKQYSEMTRADMDAAAEAANAQAEKMGSEMEGMPAAMRERMQKMMGGGEVTLTKGGTRTIAGYPAQEYVITRGDSMTMRIWTTTELEPPVSADEMRRLASFGGGFEAMRANPMLKGMAAMADKMKEVRGFQLADSTTFSMMGHETATSREATEVRKGAIPAATFDVAALAPGYKKVASPLARAGRR